jgi:hypothetical protein
LSGFVVVPPGLELVLFTEEEVLDALHRLRSGLPGDVDIVYKEDASQNSADDEASGSEGASRKRRKPAKGSGESRSKRSRLSPASGAGAESASEAEVRAPLERASAPVLTTQRDTVSGLLGFVTTANRQDTERYLQSADLSLRPVSI